MRKSEALTEVKARGFTVHFDTGESGDYAFGSRLYFKKPDSPLNDYGIPLVTATVSRVSGCGWLTSYFGENNG